MVTKNIMDIVQKLDPWDIPMDETVKQKFIEIYSMKFGKSDAHVFYEQQSREAYNVIRASERLRACTKFSIYNALVAVAINGLSLVKENVSLCYLEANSVCLGIDPKSNKKIYELQAKHVITGYGEMTIRQRIGQIRNVSIPVIVYDCDKFSYGEDDSGQHISYMKTFPRTAGAKIIAGYLKITRGDGSTDYKVMDMDELCRLRNYSAKRNSYYDKTSGKMVQGSPNDLYGSSADCTDIDPGFFSAKIIKHAFSTYPKLEVGSGSVMQSDIDDAPVDVQAQVPAEEVREEEKPEPFGQNEPAAIQGVTVNNDDEDDGGF